MMAFSAVPAQRASEFNCAIPSITLRDTSFSHSLNPACTEFVKMGLTESANIATICDAEKVCGQVSKKIVSQLNLAIPSGHIKQQMIHYICNIS